jgi:hypothetical protein
MESDLLEKDSMKRYKQWKYLIHGKVVTQRNRNTYYKVYDL